MSKVRGWVSRYSTLACVLVILGSSVVYALKNVSVMPDQDSAVDHHVIVIPSLTTTVTPFCWTHTQDTIPDYVNTNVFSLAGTPTAFTLQLTNSTLNQLRAAVDLYGSGLGSAGTVRYAGNFGTTATNRWVQDYPVWQTGSQTCAAITLTGTDSPTAGYTTIDIVTRDVVGRSNR